jgi:hypothetical protein
MEALPVLQTSSRRSLENSAWFDEAPSPRSPPPNQAAGRATGTTMVSICSNSRALGNLLTLRFAVSLYSSGSAPPTSYNSPAVSPYPLSRDDSSSPNGGGVTGIRLPNAPLSDIASINVSGSPRLHSSSPSALPGTPNVPANGSSASNSPRRSQTSPEVFFPPTSTGQDDYFMMRRRTESVGSVHSQHDGNAQLINDQPASQLLASPIPTPVAS